MRASSLLSFALVLSAGGADGALRIPPLESETLDNGLHLQVVRHATVPLVSIELWVSVGSVDDPVGKEGLAALTADALRKGAGGLDAEAYAEALDFLGAESSTSVDPDRTRLSLELRARDLEPGLALLADAVRRPALDAAEIAKLRAQMAESVAQAKENPRNVLESYARAHLFGDHPYGRPVRGTETSLPSIGVEEVRAFHSGHYGADRIAITVAGDVDPARVRRLVRAAFGDLGTSTVPRRELSAPHPPATGSVLLVDKVDTPQTWFTIGGVGPSWLELEDHAAVTLVRTVFGGRFTSWLNQALRVESGLTYGARYEMQRLERGGTAWISTFTATATTREAIDLALAQLDRLHDEGIDEAALASARAYVLGQEPYDYETAADLAAALARLRLHGIDRSHLDDYFDALRAVTVEDCRRAIERHFRRDALSITAIGVADEVRSVLATYGELRERSIGAPGFAP